jgi:hypothetical protein
MKYGRLAPHPEETHPRVWLHDHLAATVPIRFPVDWYGKVAAWPMYGNDSIGDCTCAGVGHLIQAWTANAGTEVTLPDASIVGLYERFGYNPADVQPDGTNPTDKGAVEQDVLQSLVDNPVDGHEIVAFTQVDHTNPTLMKAALDQFGGLYVGIECPESMQQQFAAGEVIDFVPGSPVEGGHCIVIVGWDTEFIYIVTWGKLVKMTWAFWTAYGDEAWAVITKDWIEANGETPSCLDLQGLLAAFRALGEDAPAPAPAAPQPWYKRAWAWLQGLLSVL